MRMSILPGLLHKRALPRPRSRRVPPCRVQESLELRGNVDETEPLGVFSRGCPHLREQAAIGGQLRVISESLVIARLEAEPGLALDDVGGQPPSALRQWERRTTAIRR